MPTRTVTAKFGTGGSGLTPNKSSGQPSLAEILLGAAADIALLTAVMAPAEEVLPLVTQVGVLLYEASVIEFVDNAGANVAQVAAAVAPGAGEFKIAADRRTVTFGDAIASAIVSYTKAVEQAAHDVSDAATFALVNDETLLVSVDRGTAQTFTFITADFANMAVATAAEVAAVIEATIVGASAEVRGTTVVLRSDTTGVDSYIEVTGGTAEAALGFAGTEQQGTGITTLAG